MDINKKGVALLTVLIFSIIALIITIATTILISNQSRLAETKFRRMLANYAANAGIQYVTERMRPKPAGAASFAPNWNLDYCITAWNTCPPLAATGSQICAGVPAVRCTANNINLRIDNPITINGIAANPPLRFNVTVLVRAINSPPRAVPPNPVSPTFINSRPVQAEVIYDF